MKDQFFSTFLVFGGINKLPKTVQFPIIEHHANVQYGTQGDYTVIEVHAHLVVRDSSKVGEISIITQFTTKTPFNQIDRQTKLRMIEAGCQSVGVEFQRATKDQYGKPIPVLFPGVGFLENVLGNAKTFEESRLGGANPSMS